MSGESSQTQTQSSSTAPWAPAMPAMTGLLGQLEGQLGNANLTGAETTALDNLQKTANAGNPYADQIGGYAKDLLSGGGANGQAGAIQGGLDAFKTQMSPYASADYSSLNDPRLRAALDQVQNDTTNSVRGQFAAGGRSFSPDEAMAVGRGVSAAQAPLILNQFNQDRSVQQGAAKSLYDAQNNTGGLLTGLTQQSLANRGLGVDAAGKAIDANNYGANQSLAIEAQRRGIPMQALGLLAQIGIPIAGLGGTSSGTATMTKNPSLLDQTKGWLDVGKTALPMLWGSK